MALNTKNPEASSGHSRRGRPRKSVTSADQPSTYVSTQDERHKRDQQVNARVSAHQRDRIEELFEQAKKNGFEGSKGDFIFASVERFSEPRPPTQIIVHPTVDSIDSLAQTVHEIHKALVPAAEQIPRLVSASDLHSRALVEVSKGIEKSALAPSLMLDLLTAMTTRMNELSSKIDRLPLARNAGSAPPPSHATAAGSVPGSTSRSARSADQPTSLPSEPTNSRGSVFRKK